MNPMCTHPGCRKSEKHIHCRERTCNKSFADAAGERKHCRRQHPQLLSKAGIRRLQPEELSQNLNVNMDYVEDIANISVGPDEKDPEYDTPGMQACLLDESQLVDLTAQSSKQIEMHRKIQEDNDYQINSLKRKLNDETSLLAKKDSQLSETLNQNSKLQENNTKLLDYQQSQNVLVNELREKIHGLNMQIADSDKIHQELLNDAHSQLLAEQKKSQNLQNQLNNDLCKQALEGLQELSLPSDVLKEQFSQACVEFFPEGCSLNDLFNILQQLIDRIHINHGEQMLSVERELKGKVQELDNENESLATQLKDANLSVNRAVRQIKQFKVANYHIQQEEANLKQKLNTLGNEYEQAHALLEKKVVEEKQKVNGLTEQYHQACTELETKTAELEQLKAAASEEVQSLRMKLQEADVTKIALLNEHEDLRMQLLEANQEKQTLKVQLDSLNKTNLEIDSLRETLNQTDLEASQKVSHLNQQIQELEEELSNQERTFTQEMQAKQQMLNDSRIQFENQSNVLVEQLKESEKANMKLLTELETTMEEFKVCQERLTEQSNEVASLVKEKQDLLEKTVAEKIRIQERNSQLESEVIDLCSSIEQERENNRIEIEQLQQQLTLKVQEMETFNVARQNVVAQVSSIQSEMRSMKDELNFNTQRYMEQYHQACTELETKTAELEQLKAAASEEVQSLRMKLQEADVTKIALLNEHEDLRMQLLEANQEKQTLKAQLDSSVSHSTQADREKAILQANLQSAKMKDYHTLEEDLSSSSSSLAASLNKANLETEILRETLNLTDFFHSEDFEAFFSNEELEIHSDSEEELETSIVSTPTKICQKCRRNIPVTAFKHRNPLKMYYKNCEECRFKDIQYKRARREACQRPGSRWCTGCHTTQSDAAFKNKNPLRKDYLTCEECRIKAGEKRQQTRREVLESIEDLPREPLMNYEERCHLLDSCLIKKVTDNLMANQYFAIGYASLGNIEHRTSTYYNIRRGWERGYFGLYSSNNPENIVNLERDLISHFMGERPEFVTNQLEGGGGYIDHTHKKWVLYLKKARVNVKPIARNVKLVTEIATEEETASRHRS